MRQAAAKAHIAQRGANVRIVLFQARLRRCRRGEGFATELAAQLLQLEAGRGKQGLGGNAHDLCGPLEQVEFALLAVRTGIARMELRVGHLNQFGPGVVGGGWGKSWPVFSVLAPKIIRANRPMVVFLASMAPMSHWRVRNTFSTNR